MEPTVFGIALIVIVNIRDCVSIGNNTAQRKNPIVNFNELIEGLIARNGGNHTINPNEDTIIIRNHKPHHEQEPSTEKPKGQESPASSTEPALNNKNSKIIYVNNFPFDSDNDGKTDDSDSKNVVPSSDTDNVRKNNEPPSNLSPLRDSKKTPWPNNKESSENLPTRRGMSKNVAVPSNIRNLTDHGVGLVLKEEIVFEIEDEKPPEYPKPPIKFRLHTTTTKPLPTYKPNIKGKNITTIKYLPYFSGLRHVLRNNTEKPKLKGPPPRMKIQTPQSKLPIPGEFINKINFESLPQPPKHSEENIKLHTELNKLNEKISKLQEILEKTLDKQDELERESHKNLEELSKLHDKPHTDAGALRAPIPDVDQPDFGRSLTNESFIPLSHSSTPHVSRQGIPENFILSKSIVPPLSALAQNEAPLIDPHMLQRQLLLLKLANIAKMDHGIHDVHLLSKTRNKSKYIFPVPVYRRRVILKPIAKII
ncbi:uncharacterized protein LOC125242278 [Leguminivora glycinivorella]|uniref:uncharacterized protein LOC125242278 n=1 Tax=Leguminivora glycinivorella TaxID=1035111 RepID=UPI00200CD8A8|nr:uncharacterized protein LOC125242278 [Leguminivora glycinivorella]